jgi:hypothetical protein
MDGRNPAGTIFRGTLETRPLVARLTDRALTIALGDDEVISWDRAGRLYSVWAGNRTWRRGFGGGVLEKWRDETGTDRRALAGEAADALVEQAAARARGVLMAMGRAAGRSAAAGAKTDAGLWTVVERAARFGATAARADAQRFAAIYGQIGILPPDQYLATVVQATEGCPFNGCVFCELYRQKFRVRTIAEFTGHLSDVRAYMGDSLLLRGRRVFLGAANALALPNGQLLPMMEAIADSFGDSRPGVSGFVDGCSGARKSSSEYRALARAGLRRVYVGLESGHDPLLALARKPSTREEVVRTVRAIAGAGVSVGVIVIVGLGGGRFAEEHVRDTIATLNQMGLARGDLVYLSDLVEPHRPDYSAVAASASIRALTPDELQIQRRRICAGLEFGAARAQVVTYDIREFVA